MRIQTILHPTDCTEISQPALNYAADLARDYRARVIILHTVETLGPENVTYGEAVSQLQPEGYRQRLWESLQQIRPADPTIPVEYLLLDEEPASAILRIARERQCDLIVLGTHARHGLQRLFEGSIAEQVLRSAPCPVLVVRG